MEDPVIAQDGHTYERQAIKRWFDMGKRISPKTGARLLSTELTPNHTMRSLIQDIKAQVPVLARHRLDMHNIEAALKLREEEIEEKLIQKGSLLEKESQDRLRLEEELQQKMALLSVAEKGKSNHPGLPQQSLQGFHPEKLTDKREIRKYFFKGMLEITPNNYQILLKHSLSLEAAFHSYDKGLSVKGWPVSMGMDSLIDLLMAFSKVTRLKVDINWDQAGQEEEVAATIARSLQFYEQLTCLELSGCHLSDASWQEIVACIPEPACLKEIDVRGNLLTGEVISNISECFPNLIRLERDITRDTVPHGRKIEQILEEGNNEIYICDRNDLLFLINHPLFKANVYEVSLTDNCIDGKNIKEFTRHLQGTRVHTIDLSENKIGAEGAVRFAKHLQGTLVHTIDLSKNKIGDQGAIKFAKHLQGTQIHTVDLSRNKIGDQGAAGFAKYLPGTIVHTVNLSGNCIGAAGASELAKALPATRVHTLHLSGNEIGSQGAIKFAKYLPSTQVHTLYLQYNKIGDEGAIELAKALPDTQLHILNLGGNYLGDRGVEGFAKYLPETLVHTINLSQNKIGDEGAAGFAKYLPETLVHTVNLSHNQIGSQGAIELAKALPATRVHTLDLGGNRLGDQGVEAFAKHLQGAQVHTVELRYNHIGNIGAISLAQYLKSTNVYRLYLTDNQIDRDGAITFAKHLEETNVRKIHLRGNKIEPAVQRLLIKQYPRIKWKF
jgi:Ran GTPase-activating protein (RanGAP) involved in mRNA processing and transport